jgi:hypothetical protein
MSFLTMWNEATGIVPKLPTNYAQTLVNRAWRDVRRQSLWSFLMFEANWTSPGIINAGTVSVVQGQTTVTFDPVYAAPALNAIATANNFPSAITARQFRVGVGTIYNIWAWSPSTGVATLDRPYQESTAAASPYMVYQCYYPAPMQDWWQWIDVRDMVNWNYLVTTAQRSEIDARDPQRTIFYIPTHVVPYQIDQNPASPTAGRQLFELWGQPQYQLTYQLYGMRKGVDLTGSQSLPPQIGEDCVMALVRAYAYEWAEANKQDARAMGSDFRFLIGDAKADYSRLFREYRRQDRAAVDNFRTKLRREWSWPNLQGWYSSIAGYASAGAPW